MAQLFCQCDGRSLVASFEYERKNIALSIHLVPKEIDGALFCEHSACQVSHRKCQAAAAEGVSNLSLIGRQHSGSECRP